MGWEDYYYGHQLRRSGYLQFIVNAAETIDGYEYKQARALGRELTLFDKPNWYLYYSVRNLLSINLYRLPNVTRGAKTLVWALAMLGHVWASGKSGARLGRRGARGSAFHHRPQRRCIGESRQGPAETEAGPG
jgi:hypothetical protein